MKVPSWFVTARVRESMGVQAVQIQGRWGRGMNPRRLLISLFSLVVAMAGLPRQRRHPPRDCRSLGGLRLANSLQRLRPG
jgi:hypothetical protein